MDKKQDEREKSYQEIIVSLTEKFDVIEDIDKNVRNIKNSIVKFKNKTV